MTDQRPTPLCDEHAEVVGYGSSLEPTGMIDVEIARRLERERDAAVEALNKIASWREGDEVNGSFDEPNSAEIARVALAEIKEEG